MRLLATFLLALLTIFSILPEDALCQSLYTSGGRVHTKILGTSNIHDWVLDSQVGECSMILQWDRLGQLSAISNISFSMQVNSLKSEHGSQMDNNTYKAMDEPNFPQIRFMGSASSCRQAPGATYILTVPGKLSIHGVTRDVVLSATARQLSDKSFTIEGNYPLVTTDYNVPPISIMLGAIQTSAKVTIRYAMTLKPQ